MLTFAAIIIAALAGAIIALTITVMRLFKQVRNLRASLGSVREQSSSADSLAFKAAIDASECKGQTASLSEAVMDIIKEGGDRRYMRAG